MKVKAVSKFVRGSARKVRIPADVVRGMMAVQAVGVLKYMPKKAAHDVRKVVMSALANAKNNYELNPENLFVSEIRIDEAARFKRFKEDSKGGYKPFIRKNCHITVILDEVGSKESAEKKSKKGTMDALPVQENVEKKKKAKSVKAAKETKQKTESVKEIASSAKKGISNSNAEKAKK